MAKNMENLKEAVLYEKLEDCKVKCLLCPRYCIISPDKTGYCGVRKNEKGLLYTLIYGKVSSINVDPIEKKPLFHFHPGSKVLSLGTYGCNMRCIHCQNWQIAHAMIDKTPDMPYEYIEPEQVIKLAEETGSEGIAFTYNEPTIWMEYALDVFKLAKKKGLYTVFVTNGYITKEAIDLIGPYLDSFRVDIKGFNDKFYKNLAKVNNFETILEATKYAKDKWNMHVEVITLVIPGWNDDDEQLREIAEWIVENLGVDTPWHVTCFTPYLELKDVPMTPIETLENAHQIGLDAGLRYVYIGNVFGHPAENTYCPKCQSVVIERMGYDTAIKGIENNKCEVCGEIIPVVI
jgi:pyruvate formate lyase activating enzyme